MSLYWRILDWGIVTILHPIHGYTMCPLLKPWWRGDFEFLTERVGRRCVMCCDQDCGTERQLIVGDIKWWMFTGATELRAVQYALANCSCTRLRRKQRVCGRSTSKYGHNFWLNASIEVCKLVISKLCAAAPRCGTLRNIALFLSIYACYSFKLPLRC